MQGSEVRVAVPARTGNNLRDQPTELEKQVVGCEMICMMSAVFWVVTPCLSYKNRRFGGT
jgi:hypothetical protein